MPGDVDAEITDAVLHYRTIFPRSCIPPVFVPAATAALGKVVASAVLFLTGLRFVLTGIYHLSGAAGVQYVAGVEGLVLVVVAVYAVLALQLEDLQHRTVLPILRRGRGRASIEGNIEEQIVYIDTEAGVREQL